jgi:hypothetical protein
MNTSPPTLTSSRHSGLPSQVVIDDWMIDSKVPDRTGSRYLRDRVGWW